MRQGGSEPDTTRGYIAGVVIITIFVGSCVHEPFQDPAFEGEPSVPGCVDDGTVCFESSVLPIFVSSCARSGCHDALSRREGYVLDSYASIVKKGISPGKATESELYKILFATGDDRMPPDAPLSQAQKDSIALWINQGARNTTNCNCFCDSAKFTYANIIQPTLSSSCVGCHKPGALGGNINLSTYAAVKIQADNGNLLGSIQHSVGYVPMPQGGKLSDCQISQIKNWIEAGAANN